MHSADEVATGAAQAIAARALRSTGHRALRVVTGSAQACREAAAALTGHYEHLRWIGDKAPARADTVALNKSRQWLGSECDALVFDAHAGFDPNALGAAAGTVRAGGVLALLCPPLDAWAGADDPVNRRVAVHGHVLHRSRYLQRLAALLPALPCTLETAEQVIRCENRDAPGANWSLPDGPTPSQQAVLDQLGTALLCDAPVAAVLRADRGRGKSATLGWLAAHLRGAGASVAVSAPSRRAAQVLYKHAEAAWPSAWHRESLPYVAPDAERSSDADILLVDEAASLHLGLTQRLLDSHAKIVFAGTVHGYEGAGRGFATRFKQLLGKSSHQAVSIALEQPIRWAQDDPLEHCVNALLVLDATAAAPRESTRCLWLDRDELSARETQLRGLYALLAEAHYRTRPLDLRHMLDGPNLRIAVLGAGHRPAAIALVAQEGGFTDAALVDAIVAGRRRPRGHLLPQLLAWQYTLPEMLALRCWRVVRIAVYPDLQRRGLGTHLLNWLRSEANLRGIDALGCSFGADTDTCDFWHLAGYRAAYLGHVREATSGQFAAAMVQPLSDQAIDVLRAIRTQFAPALGSRDDVDEAVLQQLRSTS